MNDIMLQFKIHSSPDRVYQAITTSAGISNWWTRDAVLDARAGGIGIFGFNEHQFIIDVRVGALEKNKRLAFDEVKSSHGGFDGTSISFELDGDSTHTTLKFSHRGFKSAEAMPGITTRWAYYLYSLKKYLEEGTGTPNPNDSDVWSG